MLRYALPEYRLPRAVIRREVELIRRLGVEFRCGVAIGADVTLNDLAGKNPGEKHAYFFDGRSLPVDASFIDLFRPVAKAIAADLQKMKVPGNDASKISYDTPHAATIDRLSISEWLEKRGLTGLVTSILRAAYVGEYGLEIDQQSALNLLMTMGEEMPLDDVRIFGDSDERFHIAEGNDSVPSGLAKRLDTPVEFGTRLESIARDGNGFRLGLRRDAASADEKADIVVLALPFTLLRQVDLRVDPRQFPTVGVPYNYTAQHPMVPFKTTDFWAQGVNFGLEFKF